jgi:hypothetical protein
LWPIGFLVLPCYDCLLFVLLTVTGCLALLVRESPVTLAWPAFPGLLEDPLTGMLFAMRVCVTGVNSEAEWLDLLELKLEFTALPVWFL